MGRPKSNKPKPTIKGKRGRPRKNNPTHPSHDIDNDVGHEVENLLQEQNSNISEEEDEIEGGQDEENTTIASSSSGISKPPPGKPISNFTMQSWPSWRKKFFTNWREDTKVVHAQCLLCQDQRFFSGSKQAYTNFSTHCSRVHCEEWQKLITPGTARNQSSIKPFTVQTTMPNSRKKQLDVGLTRVVSEGNLPLNILTISSFREWIEVTYSLFKSNSVFYYHIKQVLLFLDGSSWLPFALGSCNEKHPHTTKI